MSRLKNKIAVITGGNSGIGLSTARVFIEEGAKVVIFGRNQKTLDDAVETLGSNAIAVQGDVTSTDDLDKLFATAKEEFGNVDIVFANAGVAEFHPIEAIDDAHFNKIFNINVNGKLKTVQRSLGVLNDNASIILTSSGVNRKGIATSSGYGSGHGRRACLPCASKTCSAPTRDC